MISLEERLEELERRAAAFKPGPIYSRDGDCLIFELEDICPLADRIDSLLTIYRDPKDEKRFIGFQIKGLTKIIAALRDFDEIHIKAEKSGEVLKIRLKRVLFSAYQHARQQMPDQRRDRTYSELFDMEQDPLVDIPVVV